MNSSDYGGSGAGDAARIGATGGAAGGVAAGHAAGHAARGRGADSANAAHSDDFGGPATRYPPDARADRAPVDYAARRDPSDDHDCAGCSARDAA